MITWIWKIIRSIFFALDKIIYWFVELVYQLFMMIAESTIFSNGTIEAFAGRIYVLLGVVMLFRVAISMVNYIVNPDQFTDSKQGGASLIKKTAIILISIIAVPYAFEAAYTLQRIVLSNNVIGSLILGMSAPASSGSGEAVENDYIKQGGMTMSYYAYSAFFTLEPKLFPSDCTELRVLTVQNGDDTAWENWDSWSSRFDQGCADSLLTDSGKKDKIKAAYYNAAQGTTDTSKYDTGLPPDFRILIDADIANWTVKVEDADIFTIDYSWGISTACGGFLVWILIIFCMDIAVRSIKLGFLQLIAPVPLISYLAPGQKGEKALKDWVSECGKTYVDVFMRLAAIFFAIFIISEICRNGITNSLTGQPVTNPFVFVFIILGALMFAKQLPELLKSLFGVDLGGKGFTLNPLKKISEGAIGGKAIAGGLGLAGRTAGNLVGAGGNLLGSAIGRAGGLAGSRNKFGRALDGTAAKAQSASAWMAARRANARQSFNRFDQKYAGGKFGEIGEDVGGAAENVENAIMGNRYRQEAAKFERRMKNHETITKNTEQLNKLAEGRVGSTVAGLQNAQNTKLLNSDKLARGTSISWRKRQADGTFVDKNSTYNGSNAGEFLKALDDQKTSYEMAMKDYAMARDDTSRAAIASGYSSGEFTTGIIESEYGKIKASSEALITGISEASSNAGVSIPADAASLKKQYYASRDAVTTMQNDPDYIRAKSAPAKK